MTARDEFKRHPELGALIEQLVTATDIARLCNVRASAVSNWQNRHRDFPTPVMVAGNSELWVKDEVLAWYVARLDPDLVNAILEANE